MDGHRVGDTESSVAVTETPDEARREILAARRRGATVGVVPTMGALHEGHLSLLRAARDECDFVVATIFVNPTQFGPNEDFGRYPRTFADDLAACTEAGVDLVFHPPTDTIYPDDFNSFVEVEGLSTVLEGKFRPGHFRGVATVVLKLFNITIPDIAFFGQKDYQQQLLIRKMCRDLNLPVTIRTCPTVREADGLALSSRNRHLAPEEREAALSLSQGLESARQRLSDGEQDVDEVRRAMLGHLNSRPGLRVDYATVADAETLEELHTPRESMVALVAAHVGSTRLIDNITIELSK